MTHEPCESERHPGGWGVGEQPYDKCDVVRPLHVSASFSRRQLEGGSHASWLGDLRSRGYSKSRIPDTPESCSFKNTSDYPDSIDCSEPISRKLQFSAERDVERVCSYSTMTMGTDQINNNRTNMTLFDATAHLFTFDREQRLYA